MTDPIIFGFGLAVCLLVGSGLATLIISKNRAIEAAERVYGEVLHGGDSRVAEVKRRKAMPAELSLNG